MAKVPISFGKRLPEPGYGGQPERFAFHGYMSYTWKLTVI